jgi:hypothetical protein
MKNWENNMYRSWQRAIIALVMLTGIGFAHEVSAAFLTFSTLSSSPQARPTVMVTVSGVTVFNGPTSGFRIPINTTGNVSIRIVSLPDYQVFDAWGGTCAGVNSASPCEFTAGVNTDYPVTAAFHNRLGTLRFTTSSADFVRAPTDLSLNFISTPDGATGPLTASAQPSASPLSLVTGDYTLTSDAVNTGNCFQSGSASNVGFKIAENQLTTVNIVYKTDRCVVVVNVLSPFKGSVTSSPGGIDCPLGVITDPASGSACAAYFPFLSTVTLKATANPGFAFVGWTGGCFPTLDPTCTTIAQPGAAKVPGFVAASAGSADLAVVASSMLAEDVGGGKVKISFALRNNGSSPAVGVLAEISPTVFGSFTEIPSIVSDGGACNSSFACRWNLGDLASGQSKTVSFTAGTTKTSFPLTACTLSTTADPDQTNNCGSAVATIGGVTPPATGATVSAGPTPPANTAMLKGAQDVEAAQITVLPPVGASITSYALTGVTLKASGTGNDLLDIIAVNLYPDNNGNGIVDPDEKLLLIGNGRFDADDGTARLTFPATGILGGRNYLVTLDFNTTLVWADQLRYAGLFGMTGIAGVLGLGSIGRSRRRRAAYAIGVVVATVALSNCGGGSGGSGGTIVPTPVTRTYTVTVTGVNVANGSVAETAVGVPVTGAEISLEK